MTHPPIPPQSMMFMGETPETFVSNGDLLLDRVWPGLGRPPTGVLDIGCGYGRLAHALARRGYRGPYLGIDVLPKPVEWLQRNFSAALPSFEFRRVDVRNGRYNSGGQIAANEFSLADIPFEPDLVLVLSVFTHMYEDDITAYLREIRRVSGFSTLVYATLFLLGSPSPRPYSFDHEVNDHCRFYSSEDPLHAIGYEEAWLRGEIARCGWRIGSVQYGFQDTVLLDVPAPRPGWG